MATHHVTLLGTLILVSSTIHLGAGQAFISNPPSSSAARAGDSFNFTCRVDGQLNDVTFEWTEYITTPSGYRIYSDPPFQPIDSNKYEVFGRYDLNIKSPVWRDGGKYSCRLTSDPNTNPAHLFVFEEHTLVATRMVDGEKHQLQCISRFGADPLELQDPVEVPVMTFEVNGVNVPGVVAVLNDATSSDPFILSGTANYTARADDDEADFTCIVSVNSPSGYSARDSMPLDINFPVEEPEFTPDNPFYYVGEHINCTAEGSPNPQYRWDVVQSPWSGNGMDGRTLHLTEEMLNDPDNPDDTNIWTCTATNTIGTGGEEHSETSQITFTVTVDPDEPQETKKKPEAWKIGVGVGVPLAIIIIVVAVIVGIMMHKKRKQKEAAEFAANKVPPPEIGSVNRGAAFPGDGDLANGTKGPKISSLPNPLPEDVPANRSRDSPGYADLGVKQISNSYPGVNVSMNSSADSFDDTHEYPPPVQQPPHPRGNNGQMNPSYQSTTPPPRHPRPTDLGVSNPYVTPNHPDTFV